MDVLCKWVAAGGVVARAVRVVVRQVRLPRFGAPRERAAGTPQAILPPAAAVSGTLLLARVTNIVHGHSNGVDAFAAGLFARISSLSARAVPSAPSSGLQLTIRSLSSDTLHVALESADLFIRVCHLWPATQPRSSQSRDFRSFLFCARAGSVLVAANKYNCSALLINHAHEKWKQEHYFHFDDGMTSLKHVQQAS